MSSVLSLCASFLIVPRDWRHAIIMKRCPEQVRAALRDFDANLEVVSTEEQREEAIALATKQEDWLYDDGWDMDAATYRQKRAELAQVGGAGGASLACV